MSDRLLIALAGLAGASGVGLSAAAAHMGGGNLATAGSFLLFHAPALLVLGLAAPTRLMRLAGYGLALGLLLFCGDLALRAFAEMRLFPMAAPSGGMLLIASWLALGVGGLLQPRK